MKLLPALLVALGVLLGGCTTKSKARQQARESFLQGQVSVRETERRANGINFTGDVKHNYVPWRDGLTLAEALVAAEYNGWAKQPREITLSRSGEKYPVRPADLLRGDLGPVLEPGDSIDIH